MNEAAKRLKSLIIEHGEDRSGLSRMIGRNAAYIQQFIERGTPRRLAEDDRASLARYFGVDESELGGPATPPLPALFTVPQLSVGASAGPGALDGDERARGHIGFDPLWLRRLATSPAAVSIISVEGSSMLPTLRDGDDILVDTGDRAAGLHNGIYVLRVDDALIVKRIAINAATLSIISDNPDFADRHGVDPATVTVIGRVIWSGGTVG
jgi:phage repressor protein C with HTH and peptisase S24 domain